MKNFKRYSRSAQVIIVVAVANFISFIAGCVVLGGDALNGHEEAGRYFLASHGKLTETTDQVFQYSRIHGLSLFITHPLAMIVGWLGRPDKNSH